MRIALVGVGNLGSALAESIVRGGVTTTSELYLVERNPNEHESLRARFGAIVVSDVSDAPMGTVDLTVLAVKPQDAETTCAKLAACLGRHTVVLSVMAGVPMAKLTALLGGHAKIARAMPNLGARVGESATVYCCNPDITPDESRKVEQIVSSFGRGWRVDDERLIDAGTAVAGSGPAYVCWFAEHIENAAQSLGFTPEQARELVLQTFAGTIRYLTDHRVAFSRLREQVTSPKGTTAAALETLEGGSGGKLVEAAVTAAFHRASELAKG